MSYFSALLAKEIFFVLSGDTAVSPETKTFETFTTAVCEVAQTLEEIRCDLLNRTTGVELPFRVVS